MRAIFYGWSNIKNFEGGSSIMKKIIVAVILIVLMYFTLQWCAISKKNDHMEASSVSNTEEVEANKS